MSSLRDIIIEIGHGHMEDWWEITHAFFDRIRLKHPSGTVFETFREDIAPISAVKIRVDNKPYRSCHTSWSNLAYAYAEIRPWDLFCRDSAATLVFNSDGHVLVLAQPDGTYVLPGGKAAVPELTESGLVYESGNETARRELAEETMIPADTIDTMTFESLGVLNDGFGRRCTAWMTRAVDPIDWIGVFDGDPARFPEGLPCWMSPAVLADPDNRYASWNSRILGRIVEKLIRRG